MVVVVEDVGRVVAIVEAVERGDEVREVWWLDVHATIDMPIATVIMPATATVRVGRRSRWALRSINRLRHQDCRYSAGSAPESFVIIRSHPRCAIGVPRGPYRDRRHNRLGHQWGQLDRSRHRRVLADDLIYVLLKPEKL